MEIKRPKKYLIFASNEGDLDFELKPVRRRNTHIDVAVVGFADIKTKTMDCVDENIIDTLYYRAIQNGVLDSNKQFLLTYTNIKANQYEMFALDSTKANAQIIIPYVFLPLALESRANGVFIFKDWLCFYQNGTLTYHCLCQDYEALQKCFAFLHTLYGVSEYTLYYSGGWLERLAKQEQNLAIKCVKIPQSIARLSLDLAILCLEDETLPQPFYNDTAKSLYHTKSFWGGLKIAGICALIALFPLAKITHAHYLATKAAQLKIENQALQSTLYKQKSKLDQIPNVIRNLDHKITNLYTIHSKYTSRLQIIATISEIISKNAAWITTFELTSILERGEVEVALNMHSQKEENLQKVIFDLKNLNNFHIIDENFTHNGEDTYNAKLTIKILYA